MSVQDVSICLRLKTEPNWALLWMSFIVVYKLGPNRMKKRCHPNQCYLFLVNKFDYKSLFFSLLKRSAHTFLKKNSRIHQTKSLYFCWQFLVGLSSIFSSCSLIVLTQQSYCDCSENERKKIIARAKQSPNSTSQQILKYSLASDIADSCRKQFFFLFIFHSPNQSYRHRLFM